MITRTCTSLYYANRAPMVGKELGIGESPELQLLCFPPSGHGAVGLNILPANALRRGPDATRGRQYARAANVKTGVTH